ncbi:MAG: YCF48-related protein [Patescibacteria group bacterium]|jgi:photosystem II stability/assembly factor-like uncharacterized protein
MDFSFFKLPRKKQRKTNAENDFLLPKDKEKIEKLTRTKTKYFKNIKKINYQIDLVRDSTKTLLPKFAGLHHGLRKKYYWYYNWHTRPYTKSIHWLVLLLYIISLPLVYFYLSPYTDKTKATTYDFPRWEWVNPTPTGDDLENVIACPDNQTLWASGVGGTTIRSTDAGVNWETVYSTAQSNLSMVCLDASNAFAVGAQGLIMQYNGISWSSRTSGTIYDLSKIISLGNNNLIVIGAHGTILKSTDGGITWSAKDSKTTDPLGDISYYNSTMIVGGEMSGNISISHDGGETWTLNSSSFFLTTKVFALSDTNFLVYNGSMSISTDAGETWDTKADSGGINVANISQNNFVTANGLNGFGVSHDNGNTWSIKACDDPASCQYLSTVSGTGDNVIATGSYGEVYVSHNSGDTWVNESIAVQSTFYPPLFLTASSVVMVGDNGKIYTSSDAGDNWTEINTGSITSIYGMTTFGTNDVVAVGLSGYLGVSHDKGEAWTVETDGTTNGFRAVAACGTSVVAVGINNSDGWSAAVAYSSDSGNTWHSGTFDSVRNLLGVTCFDANNFIAVGDSGAIAVSSNGGSTWTAKTSGTVQTLKKVIAFNTTYLVAIGNNGMIANSVDSGQTWTPQTKGAQSFNDVKNFDNDYAVAVGNSGTIYNSYDGGISWWATGKSAGTTSHLLSITVFDSSHGVVVGGPTSYYTVERGEYWFKNADLSGVNLTSVHALDSSNAIAVGRSGVIYTTTNYGVSWIQQAVNAKKDFNYVTSFDPLNIFAYSFSISGSGIIRYHSPANATATKLLVKLPGQSFVDGVGVSGTPDAVQAGDTVTATIYAVDDNNNLDKGNASYAGFTTTDPGDTNPGTIQLTQGGTCVQTDRQPGDPECGIGTANFIFHTAGAWTVSANDVYSILSSGTSSSITVDPGDPAKLYLSSLPATLDMGSASSAVTVGITDVYGNDTTVSSSKTIRLSTTSSDGRFSASSNGPWTRSQLDVNILSGYGTTTFYYLDFHTGSSVVTASETPDIGWTDTSGTITINSGALSLSSLGVSSNSLTACGGTLTVTAILKNSEGLALASRTVQLQSSRNTNDTTYDTISSSVITDSSGVASFTVDSSNPGDFTLTAYDQTDDLYIPQSQDISVASSSLGRISLVSSLSTVSVGSPFELTTTMYNTCDSVFSDYTGEIIFSSSDDGAKFNEKNYTLSTGEGGKYTQSVILEKEGEQTISVLAGSMTATTYVTVVPVNVTTTVSTPTAVPSAIVTTPSPIYTEPAKSLIETFQESPTLQKISKVLTPVTATVATLGLFPLLVQAFPQGFQALASLFPAIFTAAAVRRRRKPWGIVYDSLTGKPVDLAIIRAFDVKTKRLVATKVTNENGRFHFLLSKGNYYVTVTKAGYTFPPKISKFKASQLATRFGPQGDIYFGQSFVIESDDTNINLSIGLEPKISTLSFKLKLAIWLKNGTDWFLIALSYFAVPLMIIGAILTSLTVVVIQSKFNLYLSGFYAILLIAYLVSSRIRATRLGLIFDSRTREPIAGATVLIIDKEYDVIREIKTTDQSGHFAILAQRGQYRLTAYASGYKFPAKEFKLQKSDKRLGTIYFGQTVNNKKAGFVNVGIPLDRF